MYAVLHNTLLLGATILQTAALNLAQENHWRTCVSQDTVMLMQSADLTSQTLYSVLADITLVIACIYYHFALASLSGLISLMLFLA